MAMRFFTRAVLLALILGLLAPLPGSSQIVGKTTGRRSVDTLPPTGEEAAETFPVIGPMGMAFLPFPLVIPIGDREHPPGRPFIRPGRSVDGGEFFPRGLIEDGDGGPGPVLDDYLVAPALVTRKHYQLYLMYLDVFGDHSHCHPFEPLEKDHRPEGWFDPQLCEDPEQPVTGIDWFDAFGFASWSGARLATDLEWERGGLSAPAAEWLGSWYSAAWYADPQAITASPRGPAEGSVTDGQWTYYQTMAVREAGGTRSWRNIYTRSPDLGFRLAWSPPGAAEPAIVKDPVAEPSAGAGEAGLKSSGK